MTWENDPVVKAPIWANDPIVEPPKSKSFGGLMQNLGTDIKETVGGLANVGKGLLTQPVETIGKVATNFGPAIFNESKRLGAGKLITGHPIEAVKQFGEAAYEKPLTTGLDVAGISGIAKKGLGIAGKALRGGELGSEAANVVEKSAIPAAKEFAPVGHGLGADLGRIAQKAPNPLEIPDEAAQILKTSAKKSPIPPTGAGLGETVGKIGEAMSEQIPTKIKGPLGEVTSYLENKYGQIARQPGWADTVSQYLRRFAQDVSVKNVGGSVRQIRQLGPEASRAIGQYALDKGITNPFVGEIGMEQKIGDLLEAAGNSVGGIRKLATKRGAVYNMDDLLNQIKSKLDPEYTKGVEAGQKGSYMKALSEVARANPTAEGLAELSTKLNKSATGALKLKQPHGAITDVANEVSRFNNEAIKRYLSPKEINAYESSLSDYGVAKKLSAFHDFKEAREIAGRLGPGGGIRHIAQKFLDVIGYKWGAKIASRLADVLDKNPEIVSDPKALFKEFINQVEDTSADITDIIQ